MNRAILTVMMLVALPAIAAADDDGVKIPSQQFLMGCSKGDKACDKDEGPRGGTKVAVKAFTIDRTEVTVAAYRVCVSAGSCKAPVEPFCTYNVKGDDAFPVNCVDWNAAAAYCAFRGMRLPYEAEFELAARGGRSTAYPWGEGATCEQAIMNDGKTTGSANGALDGCGEDRPWSIESRGSNPFGLFDMQGNVVEWTANWYSPTAIKDFYAKGNLAGPPKGVKRVARGGAWDDKAVSLRSSNRDARKPETYGGSLGFRCVRDGVR